MSRTRVGVGTPNRRLEPGELERILAMACTDYLIFVQDDLSETLAYWADVAGDLLTRPPTANQIHVRLEARGPLDAHRDALRLRDAWGAFGDLPATYRIRNEPNQESPGVTPQEWGRYLIALRAALPPDPQGAFALYAPGLSPSLPGWDHWLRETVLAATEAEFDGLDVHAYGSPTEVRNTLRTVRQLWSGPLLCTEHNAGAGRLYSQAEYADSLPAIYHAMEEAQVEGICYFIWQWSTPDVSLPTPIDLRGSPLEAAWTRLAQSVGLDPAPPEPTVLPGGPSMIDLSGLSLWVWYWRPEYIALARQVGARRLLVKAGDGRDGWSQIVPAAEACRAAGLGCVAWSYCYGQPGEAEVLASQTDAAGLRELIVNPEVEYEARPLDQQRAWAAEVQAVRARGYGVGVCTFGNPDYHQGLDYHALGMAADVFVPMLAWMVWDPRTVDAAMGQWNKHLLGTTVPWLPAYEVGAQEFAESVQKCLTAYGGATVWDAAHLTPELVAALTGQPAPSELPEEWRPYGSTWPEVARTLLSVANDALETGRRLRDLARQAVGLWGNR